MREVLIVFFLAVLVGCGGGAPADDISPEGSDPVVEAVSDPVAIEGTEDLGGEFESPPEDALSKAEILEKLEAMGVRNIVEIKFDGGAWEVEYMVDGEEHQIDVDPWTGGILLDEVG